MLTRRLGLTYTHILIHFLCLSSSSWPFKQHAQNAQQKKKEYGLSGSLLSSLSPWSLEGRRLACFPPPGKCRHAGVWPGGLSYRMAAAKKTKLQSWENKSKVGSGQKDRGHTAGVNCSLLLLWHKAKSVTAVVTGHPRPHVAEINTFPIILLTRKHEVGFLFPNLIKSKLSNQVPR